MITIVYSIYSKSVQASALEAGLMDNDAERYCTVDVLCSRHTVDVLCSRHTVDVL